MRRWISNLTFCFVFSASICCLSAQTAKPGDADQSPTLLLKIRNVEKLLGDFEKLMPSTPGSSSNQQLAMVRTMLMGSNWIDSERSVVAGVFSEGAKTNVVALIPFRTPNILFEKALNAVARKNYYLSVIPPQPAFTINPAVEESLAKASMTHSSGNLALEISASKLAVMAEPQMVAFITGAAAAQRNPTQAGQPQLSPQDMQAVMIDMLTMLKQVETLRLGIDFSDNIFTLYLDVDALPNTLLAHILTDPGSVTRLTNYSIDMPIQFRTRAYDTSDMMNLLGSGFDKIYRLIGVDINNMKEMNKALTGEQAGGIQLSANGLAIESVSVLQPGINGEDFLRNKYLPFLEGTNLQLSNLVSQPTGQPSAKIYERTADSVVAGINVMGVKIKLDAATKPPDPKIAGIFNKLAFEMRLAAVGNLLLASSNDARMEALINKSRTSLTPAPAQGPMFRVDIKLGAFLKGIASLMPSGGTAPAALPDDLGNITIKADMKNGQLTSQTSFNIDEMKKLAANFKTLSIPK
jgi:hypothetical protein